MPSTNSNLSISLIDNNQIKNIFVKANDFILTKYSDKFTDQDSKNKLVQLSECWMTEYRARLIIEDPTYQIIFNREKDIMLFLLKWS